MTHEYICGECGYRIKKVSKMVKHFLNEHGELEKITIINGKAQTLNEKRRMDWETRTGLNLDDFNKAARNEKGDPI